MPFDLFSAYCIKLFVCVDLGRGGGRNHLCKFFTDICHVLEVGEVTIDLRWGWSICEVLNHETAVCIFYMGCIFTSTNSMWFGSDVIKSFFYHAVRSLCACVLSPSVACSINSYHSIHLWLSAVFLSLPLSPATILSAHTEQQASVFFW